MLLDWFKLKTTLIERIKECYNRVVWIREENELLRYKLKITKQMIQDKNHRIAELQQMLIQLQKEKIGGN